MPSPSWRAWPGRPAPLGATWNGIGVRYAGATIDYVGESVEGERATVKTRVFARRGRPLSLDYRMIRREGRWLIYDVVMENVSLVRNYREQFHSIIKTSSYEKLIEKLVLQ